MKRIKIKLIFSIALTIFLEVSNFTMFANEPSISTSIIVVVPTSEEQQQPSSSQAPILYPVRVSENREHNRREIIRTYELAGQQSADHISREPFEREGFRFELADIVRSEMLSFDSRDHIETITINTENNDLATILRLLSGTLEYKSDDGFIGMLTLDVSTITIESAGTRTTSSTSRRTREFPHLPSPDLSLIPRTINEGGITFNLENVEWRDGNMGVIDYTPIAETYIAVATYSTSISRTEGVGYITTAKYKGVLSRTSQNKTRYTANFIGVPIELPIDEALQISSEEKEAIEPVKLEIEIVKEKNNLPTKYINTDILESRNNGISIIALAILLVIVSSSSYFTGRFGKKFFGKFKKTLCVGLIATTFLSLPQVVIAAIPPQNIFGGGSRDIHIATSRPNTNQSTNYHLATNSNDAFIQYGSSYRSPYNEGERIGTLHVERLNRTIAIFEGESMSNMDFGAGRFVNSGLHSGNVALIGHNRGRQNGFFDFVRLLKTGDIITLEISGITRTFMVIHELIIHETYMNIISHFGDERLTLITCLEDRQPYRRVAISFEI